METLLELRRYCSLEVLPVQKTAEPGALSPATSCPSRDSSTCPSEHGCAPTQPKRRKVISEEDVANKKKFIDEWLSTVKMVADLEAAKTAEAKKMGLIFPQFNRLNIGHLISNNFEEYDNAKPMSRDPLFYDLFYQLSSNKYARVLRIIQSRHPSLNCTIPEIFDIDVETVQITTIDEIMSYVRLCRRTAQMLEASRDQRTYLMSEDKLHKTESEIDEMLNDVNGQLSTLKVFDIIKRNYYWSSTN